MTAGADLTWRSIFFQMGSVFLKLKETISHGSAHHVHTKSSRKNALLCHTASA